MNHLAPLYITLALFLAYALAQAIADTADRQARESPQWQAQQQVGMPAVRYQVEPTPGAVWRKSRRKVDATRRGM